MALTPTQWAALEAFIASLKETATLPPPTPTPSPGVTTGAVDPTEGAPYWWQQTDQERATFAAAHGLDVRQITPWVPDGHGGAIKATDGTGLESFPMLTALPTTDYPKLRNYARNGYRADGLQMLHMESEFKWRRDKADKVYQSNTAEEAEAALIGSSFMHWDVAGYDLMCGNVDPGNMNTPPHAGGGTTIEQIASIAYRQSDRRPGDPGPSGNPA